MTPSAQMGNATGKSAGCGPGRKRLSADDEVRLAGLLAAKTHTLAELAGAFGLSESYMRKIACGAKRRRVVQLADHLSGATWRMAIQAARANSGAAIRLLIALVDGTEPVPTRVRLRACCDLLRIAFMPMPEPARPIQDDGELVYLADVIEGVERERAARAAAGPRASAVEA